MKNQAKIFVRAAFCVFFSAVISGCAPEMVEGMIVGAIAHKIGEKDQNASDKFVEDYFAARFGSSDSSDEGNNEQASAQNSGLALCSPVLKWRTESASNSSAQWGSEEHVLYITNTCPYTISHVGFPQIKITYAGRSLEKDRSACGYFATKSKARGGEKVYFKKYIIESGRTVRVFDIPAGHCGVETKGFCYISWNDTEGVDYEIVTPEGKRKHQKLELCMNSRGKQNFDDLYGEGRAWR